MLVTPVVSVTLARPRIVHARFGTLPFVFAGSAGDIYGRFVGYYFLNLLAWAIAIGVALGFAVHLVNASALDRFARGLATVNGGADLRIEAAGTRGFDEALETCEDVDLCQRIRQAGHRIVASASARSAAVFTFTYRP